MKKSSYFKTSLLLGSIALMMSGLTGCGSADKKAAADTINGSATGAATFTVETAPVERGDLAVVKNYTGSLEGEAQANIVAKISERITGIQAPVGQSVEKGQPIILLDKSGTTSQYYQTEANFLNSGKNLERMKTLLGEGAISQQMLDGYQTAFDVAKANFDAARAAVELTTPISGVITALNVSLGDLATPGAVLATVANIKRIKVTFNMSESDVMQVALGQTVEISNGNPAVGALQGQVVQISRSADVRSRSFEIKALFPNTPTQYFRPGMFCRVVVSLSPRRQVLTIPNAAVLSDGTDYKVFKVVQERALQQPVQIGVSDGSRTEILQGLKESDLVVTVGATNLRDSVLVRLVPTAR